MKGEAEERKEQQGRRRTFAVVLSLKRGIPMTEQALEKSFGETS